MNQYIDDQLNKALEKAPKFELSDQFSEKVIHQIERRKQAEQRRHLYLMVFGVLGFIFVSGLSLVLFVEHETLIKLMDLTGWAVLTGLLVVIVQVLDRKLVRTRKATTI